MEAKEMENMVQDHEKRILKLEKNYGEFNKELTVVQTSQSKIENMLYSQNTEQKKLLDDHQKEQTKMLHTLFNHVLGIKKDNNRQKWQIIGSVAGGIFTGGGILYLILEAFVK